MAEQLVEKVTEAFLPTRFGEFRVIGYHALRENKDYVALVKGEVKGKENILVRVHSGCLTGGVFHSLRCDCGTQLEKALEMIEEAGEGVLLYVESHEGRGIGLMNKLKAYHLQDNGKDTVEANEELGFPADSRSYEAGAQILSDLGLSTIKLITNNPHKIDCLKEYGLKVVERVSLGIEPNEHNRKYLETKKKKMGHLLGEQNL